MSETYVIIDFETTGLHAYKDRIIEIGAVKIQDGRVVETFHRRVNPGIKIPPYISELTGLTDELLEDEPSLEEVLPEFLPFYSDAILVAHNADFDMRFLNAALDESGYLEYAGEVVDTLQLAQILWPRENSYALEALATSHDLTHDQPHQALSDAQVTAEMFLLLLHRAQTMPFLLLQQITGLTEYTDWPLRHFFRRLAEGSTSILQLDEPEGCMTIDQLMHRPVQIEVVDGPTGGALSEFDVADVVHVLEKDGPMSDLMPGYEERPQQIDMMRQVAEAFQDQKHLIVEAGTGTGKSLAYLIPSVYYAIAKGERVVVATHTINLQEQLKERDIPLLKQVIPFDFSIEVFKGRANYVCMRKVAMNVNNPGLQLDHAETTFFVRIITWLIETGGGDREELSLNGEQSDHWSKVASGADSCIMKACPWFRNCYYHKARARAQHADVLITNHSLVLTDVKTEHNVLPGYQYLVLDEAHHMEDEATKHLGTEVSYFQMYGALNRLLRDKNRGLLFQLLQKIDVLQSGDSSTHTDLRATVEKTLEQIGDLREATEDVFRQLHNFILKNANGSDAGRQTLRLKPDTFQDETMKTAWDGIASASENLQTEVRSMRKLVGRLEELGESLMKDEMFAGLLTDVNGQVKELDQGWQDLAYFLRSVGSESSVLWMEADDKSMRPVVFLYSAPIDVGPLLNTHLFSKKESVVLASATLTINNEFKYAIHQLGLYESQQQDRLKTLLVDSPFHYKKQALLCVPNDCLPVKGVQEDVFTTSFAESLTNLARVSQGRALVLFTSHRMLRETYHKVKPMLAEHGITVLAHGVDSSSRHRLVQEFQRHPKAVLFGANSFWEGVDIPGEDLSLLVIARLPFWPPNQPVVEARTEKMEREGRNSFMEYSVPQAIIRFKQGFGRLIRTRRDRGAIVVYDRRITESRYGRHFIRSLPGPWFYQGTEREVLKTVYNWLKTPLADES
ncbi:ATP-dependent DNA helicase DinG [Tumebacillus permanentifrigoris]|uniref:3'-5' exonuclease DinG n=1 Tax=Tumebacillus permanentifrigoris TaxID=378543 RepID=A0A316DC81_9BACL|nr:ATP-dependent DNA helicase DinG [Tumebacillus permanentifrigoris]PWK15565.1 ATP-dependent DNA helicase DinG [Tumebacillus permanentifrigoris]